MRVSYEWLKAMVELPEDPDDLVAVYTRTGTEVEGVEMIGAHLDHVVVGKILSKTPHPDSDHLWVCQVSVGAAHLKPDGQAEPLQIVCGAQNFHEGDTVVVALEGAVLPGDFKIKKSKLRGVMSYGMNCSARELGLGEDHDGIMILPASAPVGMPFARYQGISDVVLDCAITPNRPDCLSMEGIATETGAILDREVTFESFTVSHETGADASEQVSVSLEADALCERYVARVVRDVTVGPSPAWLQRRLSAVGCRSINNVVDVTNYVMFLTGQPLHAFDLDRLLKKDGKSHIVVRAAKEGEILTTLDGCTRRLTPNMTLITDGGIEDATDGGSEGTGGDTIPIALAGVMGGAETEVRATTSTILLESACFDSERISQTSRALNLISEASMRYERRVDADRCKYAIDIAVSLFERCCSANVCPGTVDVYPTPKSPHHIELVPDAVRAVCGSDIPTPTMVEYLRRLGCVCSYTEDTALIDVTVPSTRPDLVRDADLVEEVVRLWGMDRVVPTLPAARNHVGGLTPDQHTKRLIGGILRASGFSEVYTYCFAEADDRERLGIVETDQTFNDAVRLINPLVSTQSEMRRMLVPGLLRSVAYNLDHGVKNVLFYEMGRVFFGRPHESKPEEFDRLAGVMSGKYEEDTWNSSFNNFDFFDAKGVIENLLGKLHVSKVRFLPADTASYPWLIPGQAAEVHAGKISLGWLGVIHPKTVHAFGIEDAVVAFELDVAMLLRLAKPVFPYVEVPSVPGVEYDLALVVDEDVTSEMLLQRIQSSGGSLLDSVRLFDVYRDPLRIGKNKKSMACSLLYRAPARTLTLAEVEEVHTRLVQKVCRSLKAEVRGS